LYKTLFRKKELFLDLRMNDSLFNIFRYDGHSVSRYSNVIQSDFCKTLPEPVFDPYLVGKKPTGELEVHVESDFENCVCIISEIPNTGFCECYIFHLFAFLKKTKMEFEEFFGFTARDNHGELFEYYLLLVERYFQLLAAEQIAEGEEPERLMHFSDSNDLGLLDKKEEAQFFLNILALTSLEFRENAEILPILYRVIDLFIKQFPDALFLAILADFTESGFHSLSLVDNIFQGMLSGCSEYSFRNKRMFKTLYAFKHFPRSSYFTLEKFSNIFMLLLTSYCDEYSAGELHTAILNVTAFVMQKFPNEAAMQAINQIFTGLEKQAEMFQFILEAILVIERDNLARILEAPAFPIHPDESQKRLEEYLGGDFVEKYKFFCKQIQSSYPKDKLKELLKALSEKYFVAGIIFARLFNKSYIERGRKLAEAFDASVCGRIQSVIENSKILDGYKESPEEMMLRIQLRDLKGKIPSGILMSSGCGNKTTISAALKHLHIYHQKIHDARQAEWRDGGVALQRWESGFYNDSDAQFPRHQRLTSELNQIDELISELQKHSGSKLLKDVQDENTKEIEHVNAQIKVFDDQKHRMRREHDSFLKEAKKSILERLFGAQE
jgi:hypothetical protein